MYALSLIRPMEEKRSQPADPHDRFMRWAEDLGLPWEKVLTDAGLAPFDENRASRARLRKGEAPRVAKKLYAVLSAAEQKRRTPTETGAVMLGVEELRQLGQELADLDRPAFLELLAAVRRRVAAAHETAEASAPFGTITPSKSKK